MLFSHMFHHFPIVSHNMFILFPPFFLQDGAPKIAFSWDISGLTLVYGRYDYSIHGCFHGLYKPTNITVGHHQGIPMWPAFHGPNQRNGAQRHHGAIHQGPQQRWDEEGPLRAIVAQQAAHGHLPSLSICKCYIWYIYIYVDIKVCICDIYIIW